MYRYSRYLLILCIELLRYDNCYAKKVSLIMDLVVNESSSITKEPKLKSLALELQELLKFYQPKTDFDTHIKLVESGYNPFKPPHFLLLEKDVDNTV